MFQVDGGFEIMELLSCSHLHRRCIVEELHGIALLNVLSFDQLTQEWCDLTFKGRDIITQLPLYGIEDITCVVADVCFDLHHIFRLELI